MDDEQRARTLEHSALLAFIGGFMDGFTYVGHGHVFANAMTGNVVLLGIYGVQGSWHRALRHLPPIITFIVGISMARAMIMPRWRKLFRRPYFSVALLELLIIGVLSLLPNSTGDLWITIGIALAASLQVETFRMVNGYSYNTTFTTGNLRSLSEGLFDWIFQNNVDQASSKARDFAVICSTFFLGAAAGGSSVAHFGNKALLIDFVLLMVLLFRLWPRRPALNRSVAA